MTPAKDDTRDMPVGSRKKCERVSSHRDLVVWVGGFCWRDLSSG